MMMHLFFSPEFLDRPARWLAQRASDHRGLIHGEFLEVHSQPLENHWLKTNLSKQTTWGANAWEKLEPSEPMIFYVHVYHVSIHACKKKYYIGIINLCIYLPEYSCVLTCIQYRIRTWKTCVFKHVENFRCNYSIYKEHAYVCIVYIYVHWHIGVCVCGFYGQHPSLWPLTAGSWSSCPPVHLGRHRELIPGPLAWRVRELPLDQTGPLDTLAYGKIAILVDQ